MDDERLDPDAILRAIKKEESREKGGKLKIFLGMSAGVGKTYTMLEAGQKERAEGVDVVIGIVDTHGRQETIKLTEGLTAIPLAQIEYKGTTFSEFDLDAALKRKPKLILVDELAHTNVPGSRHPKRWQDVIELLDAGIDVYTTLNVQHIESRKELVENITGIPVYETVPDLILERADDIELVDITPRELLVRLKEGKVYLGPQSEIAARNFFQADRLTALRELSLRFTAEKVDHDLHEMIQARIGGPRPWKAGDKLLVCVSPSPHSQHLIRAGRRLAFNLNVPWIALYVDDGSFLDEEEKSWLAKNMSLARELGAEVLTITDPDIPGAIQRIAKQRNVTQILLGRKTRKTFWNYFLRSALLSRLMRESIDVDIHVMHDHVSPKRQERLIRSLAFTSKIWSYLTIVSLVLLITLFNGFLIPFVGFRVVGFIYLISILVFGLFFSQGPLLVAAILSAAILNFFFIPFHRTYVATIEEDYFWFGVFFLTAVVTGILASRIRERELLLRKRDDSTQAIYEIVREIASAPTTPVLLLAVKERLGTILAGKCDIILKTLDDGLNLETSPPFLRDEKELAVASWVFTHGKEAGWSTDTLPSVKNLYIPLKGFTEIVGILSFQPINPATLLTNQEINLLFTVGKQLANYIERSMSEERARKVEYMQQVEKVYQTILRSITSEFQSPLGSMKEGLKKLKKKTTLASDKVGSVSLHSIEDSAESISKITDNIAAMSTLCSGLVTLKLEPNSIKDLLDVCLTNIRRAHDKHIFKVKIDPQIPPVPFDFSLLEILIYNILFNSIEYSPDGSAIEIEAKTREDYLYLTITDQGRGGGVSPEKVVHLPGSPSSGLGLGLAIAQSIAEAHKGELLIHNKEPVGTEFILILPLRKE